MRLLLVCALVFCANACAREDANPNATAKANASANLNAVVNTTPAPDGEALANTRCAICHTPQYLWQQRLTPAQWQKTVAKMRDWGAPLDDAEADRLATWLAARYPIDKPDASFAAVATPAGAGAP